MGLTLEWVFGSIVSTAEKARDAAKRALGGWVPTPEATVARIFATKNRATANAIKGAEV